MKITHKRIAILLGVLLIIMIPLLIYLNFEDQNPKRDEYIRNTIEEMSKIKPNEFLAAVKLEDGKYCYVLRENCAIKFKDGNWVYISLRSRHGTHDTRGRNQIGDVTIAMDSKKNIYVSYHHICGCIYLPVDDSGGFSNVSDFYNSSSLKKYGDH